MKLCDLIKELSEFDGQRDVVLFSNGYKEIKIVDSEDGVIIAGKGKVCPSAKTAIENEGREPEPSDLCCCDNYETGWFGKSYNTKLDTGE